MLSGIGCYIRRICSAIFVYADDIILLSSTRKAITDAIIPSTQAANLNNGDHDVMNEIIIDGHNEDDGVKLTLV